MIEFSYRHGRQIFDMKFAESLLPVLRAGTVMLDAQGLLTSNMYFLPFILGNPPRHGPREPLPPRVVFPLVSLSAPNSFSILDGPLLFRCFGVTEADQMGLVDIATGKGILFTARLPESYSIWMGKVRVV